MKVLEFRWLGVGCEDLDGMKKFCTDVLGLEVIKEGEGRSFVEFQLESGQRFEVFGPKSRHFKLHARPVLAFVVGDIKAARSDLEAAGIEILTRTATYAKEASWLYFRGPDGNVYELQQWKR